MKFFIARLLLGALLPGAPLRAVDYFVANNGNDNNTGRSAALPFRTISRAAALVGAGDTVTVAAGTYNEAVTIVRPGTAGAPISFRSVSRGAAKITNAVSIRTSYVEFSGFDVANPFLHGITLVGHHLTIRNNDIHNCQGNGINSFASDYLTIEANRLFRNGLENDRQSSGIQVFQPAAVDQAPGFHIIIRGNQAFDNESRSNGRSSIFTVSNGILLDDFRNTQDGSTAGPYRPATLVENNLLYNNVGRALVISNSDNITVRNNTAWGNLRIRNTTNTVDTNGTFTVQDADGVSWYNNIVSVRGAPDVAIFETRTTNGAWDYNVIWNGVIAFSNPAGAGLGGHNLFTDPLLVDPVNGNFRPGRGSVAIDAGSATLGAATDFDGAARPLGRSVDIGAFEAVPDSTPAAGPPVFTTLLAGQSVLAGGFTTLVAYASGAAPLAYQWTKNGAPIRGATKNTLTFAPLQSGDGGNYAVTVTSGPDSITSTGATLNVASVPNFVWRNPVPEGGTLNAVAFGAGKFVAVGVGGRVLVSIDGANWSQVATLPTAALNGVGFDDFQWVAVGNNGALFTSRDGVDWTQRNPSTTSTLRSVATVNGAWVVAGDTGTIVTSLDGVNWSLRSTGATQNLFAVAGTTGRYVAAGQTGTLLTSPDTVNWTRVTLNEVTGDLYAVAYLNGQFIAAGVSGIIYASADGTTWTARTSPGNTSTVRGVASSGARYVFVTDTDRVLFTPDLASYTNITIPAYNITAPRWSVAYGAGRFVTVGNGGEISSSPDGATWTARGAQGARFVNYGVAFLHTLWLAVGSHGGVATSPDGAAWTRQTTPIGNWLRGCAHGAGRYVVAGDQGTIISSLDGVTWTSATSGTGQNLNAVAFANGRFVAVGNNGTVVTSANGTTWTAATSGVTSALQNIGVFGGRFYAIGSNGVILVSSDGTTWSAVSSGTTQTLLGIGTDGNTLYIVGGGRTILASTDGQAWSARTVPALNNGTYRGITKSNGGWLVVGNDGVALFSLDGLDWDFLPTLAGSETLNAVASNGGSTIATGAAATILQASNPAIVPTVGAPVFTSPIASQNLVAGAFTTWVANVSGTAPFSYQWKRNGTAIAGATSAALSFAPIQTADAGTYTVTVTNAVGSGTSTAATLVVTPLPNFVWRNPVPEGGTLNAVTFANGKFMAAGLGSRVLTSTDGVNWSLAAVLPTTLIYGVGSDGFQWIAVGNNGALFTSLDTMTWAQRNPSTNANLRSVAKVNNGWIACGDSGTVITSSDGATWAARPTGVTQALYAVAGTAGRYVAAGQGGTLLTSPDSIRWTRVTPSGVTGDFLTVVYHNGQFVAAGASGSIFSSTDGTAWTARTSPGNTNWLRGVAFNGSQYVFIADGDRVVVTPDLTSYTNVTVPAYNITVPRLAVAYGAGQFVTVGSGGEISSSSDGVSWTPRGSLGARDVNHNIAYLDSRWVAVGTAGGLMTSPDGVSWTRQNTPTSNRLRGCAYGAGRYVVTGDNGTIINSPDGVLWTTATSGTTQSLYAVAFTNGRFVAVGNNGVIVTSTNGATWIAATSGVTGVLQNVGVFGGRFYAIGTSGVILVSSDATSWTALSSGTTQSLLGIGTDGNTLFVVGLGRTILASTDGQSWTPRTPPSLNNSSYRGIAKSHGGWLVVGDVGVALFSLDGVVWDYLPNLALGEGLNAVASNGVSAIATGNGATILQAGDPALLPSGGAPTFTSPIASQNLLAGAFTTLVANMSGAAPLSYQWYKNGTAIASATTASLGFVPVQTGDAGAYTVTVSNTAGSITSVAATLAVTPKPNFVWRNPLPEGGTLNAVTFANGRFLAAGTGSRVLTSTNGVNWRLAATLPTTQIIGVGSDGLQWVAVGNNGALFTSMDTINWAQRNPSTPTNLRSVVKVNNAWIACGDNGTIITSPDGAAWTVRPTGVTQALYAVASIAGRYVAVGQGGTLLTSPDSIAWTRVPLTGVTGDFYAVAYFGDQFVAAGASGNIFSSPDGTTWTRRANTANTNALRGVAFNGAQYVFVTDTDRVVVTPDLLMFTNITIPAYNITAPRFAVTHGAGLFVTVGNGGEISSSPDGVTWTQRGSSGARWANYRVAFLNTQWVAVGTNGGLLTSPDGTTWTRQATPRGNTLYGCAYGSGRYVVTGENGTIFFSTDGVTWTLAASGTTQPLNAVAFTNGRFVAVGNNGVVLTSTNATEWTAGTSGVTGVLQNVGVFGGRFYAIGNVGVILVSGDGATWTALSSGTIQALYGIGTDGNTFYVVGGGRTILASTDGQSFAPRTPPPLNNGTYRGVAKANGGWLVVGEAGVGLFSLDGVNWEYLPVLAASENLYAVTSNGVSTIATGQGATILQAGNPALVPSRLINVATRGLVEPGGALTPGFVLRGTGRKNVIVRGIGPTLSLFGLPTALEDVALELNNQQTGAVTAANDDWGGVGALSNAFASVGAFPLAASSKDAAVQVSLPVNQGGYSVRISPGGTATTGVALAEVYDADDDRSPVRVTNVSALGYVGTDENVLTPGFVIRGNVPKLVLIRAVGPGLAAFNVGGLLTDPQLSVYAAGVDAPAASNNDWGGTAALKAAFAAAGAFSLTDNSKDAAVLMSLPPGGYSVQVSGVGSTTGQALVEIYDLDP
jgi:hypothetical protein